MRGQYMPRDSDSPRRREKLLTSALVPLLLLLLAGCGRTASEYLRDAEKARLAADRERLLSMAIRKDPLLREARRSRAFLYAAQRQLDKALLDYDHLAKNAASPEELGDALYGRGRAFELCGSLDEAVESYNAALRADPRLIDPYQARAGAYFKMGRYAQSARDWLVALERDIDSDPEKQCERRFQRGTALFCGGDWRGAAADLKAAFVAAQSPELKARAFLGFYSAAFHMNDGKAADQMLAAYAAETSSQWQQGDKSTPWAVVAVWHVAGLLPATEFLDRSEHKNPELAASRAASAHYYIGALNLAKGRHEEARAEFEKALEQAGKHSLEHHMSAAELERLRVGGTAAGDYLAMAVRADSPQEQIELCTKALGLDPGHVQARLQRATACLQAGRFETAVEDCTLVAEKTDQARDKAMALWYRGLARSGTGDHAAALVDFDAAAKADPELWQAREGLAVSLGRLRRYGEAAKVYGELIEFDPGRNSAAHWRLERAFALFCAGDWAGAAADFRTAAELDPEAHVVRTNLFISEAKLGDKARAAEEMVAYAAKIEKPGWASSVAWHAAGMFDAERLLRVSEHSDEGVQLVRTSRAYYYIGAARLVSGDRPGARGAFEHCVKLGRDQKTETWEYRMALSELAREDQWRKP